MAQTNILYVVLHGLICLVDRGSKVNDDQSFVAFLLDQGDSHTYMCGSFLAEQDLPTNGASLNLHFTNGLKPGKATLDPSKSPVVNLPKEPLPTSGVRAVLTLPRPQKISYFLGGDIGASTLPAPAGLFQQNPSTLSAVKILEYAIDDFTNLKLVDDGGKPIWT